MRNLVARWKREDERRSPSWAKIPSHHWMNTAAFPPRHWMIASVTDVVMGRRTASVLLSAGYDRSLPLRFVGETGVRLCAM